MNPRPTLRTSPVNPRNTDRKITFRLLAVWLAISLSGMIPARAAEAAKPVDGHPEKPVAPQRESLLVMYVRPKFEELAPAARAARESLMRVLEGLRFRLYSPDDVATLMTVDEQKKQLNDNSTGNLMALGRKVKAEKVVYGEMENKDEKRYFKLALLPSSAHGPIRYAQAEYSQNAGDAEMDLAVANALITLFGWDAKK